MSLYDAIYAVVARGDGADWGAEGEEWLRHPYPDETYLDVGYLADAIHDAVNAWLEARSHEA